MPVAVVAAVGYGTPTYRATPEPPELPHRPSSRAPRRAPRRCRDLWLGAAARASPRWVDLWLGAAARTSPRWVDLWLGAAPQASPLVGTWGESNPGRFSRLRRFQR